MSMQMYEEKYMRFPEGRSKAITFSYDDGVAADKKLIQIFNKYGLKGTFNLNSLLWDKPQWHGRMDERQTFDTFKEGVHEVAMHGARHVFLTKIPLPEAVNEIISNREYLEKKFGRIVRGMAYAYGDYNDEIVSVLKALGVTYARTTEPSYSFAIQSDWLRLKPTCHHADKKLDGFLQEFLTTSPEQQPKHREPWLFYIWGHSFEFDDNGNWEIIENLAKSVSGRKDIWYATNSEVYEYVQAYNNLVFSVDGERVFNPTYMPVWLEIRGKIYRVDGGKNIIFDKEN